MREYMRAFVKGALVSLERMVGSDKTLAQCDAEIRGIAEKIPLANVRDRAAVSYAMSDLLRRARAFPGKDPLLATKWAFDTLYSVCYRVETHSIGRAVADRIAYGLSSNRNRPMPVIAYVCSTHQNPRKEHRELQGKMYVDRYWRDALIKAGHGGLVAEIEPIVRDLMTVQEAVKGPHWLMTAPNCHHTLFPVTIEEILRYGSAEVIIAHHPEAQRGFHRDMKTDAQRRRKREALRRETAERVRQTSKKKRGG